MTSNIFTIIEYITLTKKKYQDLNEEEKKILNTSIYLINRYISMDFGYIEIINELQQLKLPPPYLYNIYISVIPKQKKYFKYIKKSIKETKGDDIKLLAEVFKVSEREAKEYRDKLDTKQIESLRLQVEGIKSKKKK